MLVMPLRLKSATLYCSEVVPTDPPVAPSKATAGAAGAEHFPLAVPAYQCGPIWTGVALPCWGALSVDGELTPPLTDRLPERLRFRALMFCATLSDWKLGEVGSAGRRTS